MEMEGDRINVLAETLPADKKVPTKFQLIQGKDHYQGKLLQSLKEGDIILAIGPTTPGEDSVVKMQPMLIVTESNFTDLLAMNCFVATGGLGPVTTENQVGDSTVTNRSLAWSTAPDENTNWIKLTAWNQNSKQLSELAPGTPTIAVGKVSTSQKDDNGTDKLYVNYTVDKVLYLQKGKKAAPKTAADPDKGIVNPAAMGSVDFSL